MMRNLLLLSLFFAALSPLYAGETTQKKCEEQKGHFIFAGGECIEYAAINGERKEIITVIVHGTWKEGTNTLARYIPFAETINMATDTTTVAIALPGYSRSSTNHLYALSHNSKEKPFAAKAYIVFLDQLIQAFKKRYKATTVNYIGHSAGASMGATLTGYHPSLISNIALAGGRYQARGDEHDKGLLFIGDYMEKLDTKTNYLLIYGTKDSISKPEISKDFYTLAKKKGLNVTLVKVKDAEHLDLDMTDTSVEAIEEMLE